MEEKLSSTYDSLSLKRKKNTTLTPTPGDEENKSFESKANLNNTTEIEETQEDEEENVNNVIIKMDFKRCSEIIEDKTIKFEGKEDVDKAIFKLKVSSNEKEFKWEVYHDIKDIQENFKKINKILVKGKCFESLNQKQKEYFENILKFDNAEQIKSESSYICEAYEKFFEIDAIKPLQCFTEFFNISDLSFNSINGTKPMEGLVYKKAEPRCARRAFGCICPCLK